MSFIAAITILIALGGIFVALKLWQSRFEQPALFFSDSSLFDTNKLSVRARLSQLSQNIPFLVLVLLSIAFLDPNFFMKRPGVDVSPEVVPTEGLAIYLVLDKSGSMGQEIRGQTKLSRLKDVTKHFVSMRPNDLLGLVSFARGADILSPLTLDHKAINEQLDQLEFVKDKSEDGTSIGYAIYKTTNLILATRHFAEDFSQKKGASYEIKDGVIILVTDGFQSPSPLDGGNKLRNIEVDEAARYAKEKGVRLYVVNVDPRLGHQEYSAYRDLMKKVTTLSGGQFFWADRPEAIDRIYREINDLEKSVIPQQAPLSSLPKGELPHLYVRYSFVPWFLSFGFLLLFVYIVIESVVMRRSP